MTSFLIGPLDGTVQTEVFECGVRVLDDYFRRYASQDVRRNVARVFVAAPASQPLQPAGFYTVSAGSVACADLPAELARRLPRYPVPVALIGRLAVDTRLQGQGLGSILLADACTKVRAASQVLAAAGIVVDAKDASAAAFCRHFGFVALPGQPHRLLLPASAFPR